MQSIKGSCRYVTLVHFISLFCPVSVCVIACRWGAPLCSIKVGINGPSGFCKSESFADRLLAKFAAFCNLHKQSRCFIKLRAIIVDRVHFAAALNTHRHVCILVFLRMFGCLNDSLRTLCYDDNFTIGRVPKFSGDFPKGCRAFEISHKRSFICNNS